ncbi:MAG: 30S ribosomal protein S12 methylthiotransferase RimO [Actinobacteria bacterium]|nr:30S ribosomal protein S12 methylthiotransferase RimO [Actinomycetota bacterium]
MAKFSIVTLGCPKNEVDSEGLGGLLAAQGHQVTQSVEDAEVVLVNTCGFIDPARRETITETLELAELKETAGLKGLILTGCLVARSAGELNQSLPEVDAFVDFAAYPRISDIVEDVAAGTLEERIHGEPGTRFDPAWWDATIAAAPRVRFGRAPWSYLKIAEGCDRGCTFCAIPLMRGKFRSRDVHTIWTEACRLAEDGVTELSLVSQDSVMWGRDSGEGNMAALLRRLERIDGLKRIRLMYLHPQGVTDELIDSILGSEVIVSYFDLSLQHVAKPVLRGMGRWGGRERFDSIVSRIRNGDPLAGIRSTFIMGFPGETEDHARAVESFVSDTELDWVGVFTFSQEEGTRSYDMPEQVDAEVARERSARVQGLADLTMERRARSLVGSTFEVLVERFDLEESAWIGRSKREAPEIDGEITVATDAPLHVGEYIDVRITDSVGADLVGKHEA